jgi:hypothetical protein
MKTKAPPLYFFEISAYVKLLPMQREIPKDKNHEKSSWKHEAFISVK